MAYTDPTMNELDKQKIQAFKDQYNAASAAGDKAGMRAAHAGAEAIRANYGYSGGAGGDDYVPVNGGANTAPLYAGRSMENEIGAFYDAQEAQKVQELKDAWTLNEMDYDAAEKKLPQKFDAQRRSLSSQHEIEQQNYNEFAAGRGINTGANGQVQLSQRNAYLRDYATINAAQAQAAADLQLQREKARTQFQQAVQQAILNNDVERAKALMSEAQRVDDNLVSNAMSQQSLNLQIENRDYERAADKAKTLASYGDFSGYRDLGYTDDQINTMTAFWQLLNGGNFSGGSGGGKSGGGGGGGAEPKAEPTGGKNTDTTTQSNSSTRITRGDQRVLTSKLNNLLMQDKITSAEYNTAKSALDNKADRDNWNNFSAVLDAISGKK